jgi:hypothetical protein
MPPKKNPESPKEQSERFKRDAQKLIDAGELDPTEAEKGLEGLVKRARFDGR